MAVRKVDSLFFIKRLIEIVKKRFIPIYFGILFISLSFVYWPSFFYPLRSDFWSTFYFFHRIDYLAVPFIKWLNILQYDPWSQVRFQPLAYSILYLERSVFGSNFTFFHIFNFLLYFVSILLLYKLATDFCKSKLLICLFTGIFAFLFSHFDIISWSYHAYIIFGFNSLFLGFIIYIDFLKTRKVLLLPIVIILFLAGMLCYESFVLWPLAVIILSYIKNFAETQKNIKSRVEKYYLPVIVIVYFLYLVFFSFSRIFKVYEVPLTLLTPLFSIQPVIFSIFSVCFNIVYNGILVNLMPLLACPLVIDGNINLGGIPGKFSYSFLYYSILICGVLFILALLGTAIYLFRKKYAEEIKVFFFFFFLLFSEFFIVFYFRILTNTIVFNLTQFRYLYIQNALIILLAVYLMDRFIPFFVRRKMLICIITSLVLLLNIYTIRMNGIKILSQQLVPLEKIFCNIKLGIKNGKITQVDRLYLNDTIAKKLPPLCWNREMGHLFMRGTYQWVFSEEEITCFSSFKDAKWVVDEKDFSIRSK